MLADYQRVYAEINLDNILYNIRSLKDRTIENTQIMAVVKADAYGHGMIQIACELEKNSLIYGYVVATAQEGLLLRKCGIKKPILIVGYTFPEQLDEVIEKEISITLFRRDSIGELSEAVKRNTKTKGIKTKAKVHIKIDTGMNRLGIFPNDEGLLLVKEVLKEDGIEIEGAFTHFAKADEENFAFTQAQYHQYELFLKRIEKELGYSIPIKHSDNSAGTIRYGQRKEMSVVRPGIAMYGIYPSGEKSIKEVHLKPVLSLYSRIVFIKDVEEGKTIGYGGTFTTTRRTRIATIPVGYGDGYPRSLSNKGYVLIRGQKAGITGRVCMDQLMVDVTDIPEAAEGDVVVLVGNSEGTIITVEEISEISGRFPYEFVCDLGKRIPRVYTKNDTVITTKDYFNDF